MKVAGSEVNENMEVPPSTISSSNFSNNSSQISERRFLCSVLLIAILGGAGGSGLVMMNKPRESGLVLLSANMSKEVVIGSDLALGSPAPYTIVEFIDYECPPCRAADNSLPALLRLYPGKIRLVVRNYPLRMHRHAMSAAIAAEAAREQGKFKEVHNSLISAENLDKQKIQHIAVENGLDLLKFKTACEGSAKTRVEADMRMASLLGIHSTPSFIACTPENKFYVLASLDQMKSIVK